MTPGPNDTCLSDREGVTRQWPVTPCPGCGCSDVEDCQCEVENMNFTAVAGSIYKLRNGGHGLVTGGGGNRVFVGLAGAPEDLEAQDATWDSSGNCVADHSLDLVELVLAGSSTYERAKTRFRK